MAGVIPPKNSIKRISKNIYTEKLYLKTTLQMSFGT